MNQQKKITNGIYNQPVTNYLKEKRLKEQAANGGGSGSKTKNGEFTMKSTIQATSKDAQLDKTGAT